VTAGITVALYVVILGIMVSTQPSLALGGGGMLATLVVAGLVTTRRRRA
jgi:MYXO-CTERM domain-containing protein